MVTVGRYYKCFGRDLGMNYDGLCEHVLLHRYLEQRFIPSGKTRSGAHMRGRFARMGKVNSNRYGSEQGRKYKFHYKQNRFYSDGEHLFYSMFRPSMRPFSRKKCDK